MVSNLPVVDPEQRVLSTLEHDGSRRWLYPKLAKGRFLARRRVVAYALIAVYALLPFIEIGGKPAVRLDIFAREFTLFGFTFLPTDTVLLAIFVIAVFLTVFFVTALAGRVWCGWACPQTVYMEFVFRPIERLFLGRAGVGGAPRRQPPAWRRVAMYAVFLLVCLHLAHTFLAYFVGAENLHRWIWTGAPWRRPGAFAVVAVVTGLMMFDFCYWREQLCIIGCPYGRFQSVMLDRSSAIIGYDESRGEPRGRGRDREAKGLGDCVDCSQCVVVCPTGIDIRDGLQLECVGCAQCIDACDRVMDTIGRPRALIRYSSQEALAGQPTRVVRPRVIVYSTVIVLLAGVFATLLATKSPFDVSAVRGFGRPFVVNDQGAVQNTVTVKITNRTAGDRSYRLAQIEPPSAGALGDPLVLKAASGETASAPLHVVAPPDAFDAGRLNIRFTFEDDQGATVRTHFRLLGPVAPAANGEEDPQR